MTSDEDFKRLESKVDKLTDAVMRLVLIEERQSTQGERIGKVETQVASLQTAHNKTDKTLHMWVNRGVGVWVAVGIVFTLVQFGSKWMK
jgi:uncharacterized coiled-coil protein SlyX